MKTNKRFIKQIIIGTILTSLFLTVACVPSTDNTVENNPTQVEILQNNPIDENIIIVEEDGATSIDFLALEETLLNNTTSALTDAEIEGLLFMREEEKLAQDVYLYLADVWNLQIFSNIARSEATHTEAVRKLLETNGIADPALSTELGEFADPILQELYDQLVEEGSKSLGAALRVGTAIEEIDILDLEKFLKETDNESIILVYNNLLKGSFNHLRAFVKTLENQTGEIFEPQYLDLDAYEKIINSSVANGGYGKGNNGWKGN